MGTGLGAYEIDHECASELN